MYEHDLFENYEINASRISPMFTKVVGATVIFHIIAIFTLGQVNLLQTKACDSPYIGKVCEVLDAAYVGSIFMGSERTSVDAPYEKTDIDDADVTWIDVTNQEPPFTYPEGYFAVANPESIQAPEVAGIDGNAAPGVFPSQPGGSFNGSSSGIPGIPNSGGFKPFQPQATLPGGSDIGKGAKLPPPNPKAFSGPPPTSPYANAGDEGSKSSKGRQPKIPNNTPAVISRAEKDKKNILSNESPKNLDPSLKPREDQGKTIGKKPEGKENSAPQDKTSDESGLPNYEINKRPLKDYRKDVREKLSKKEVDLNQGFSVSLNAKLNPNGRLDVTASKFVEERGDQSLVDVVKSGIEALNDGGYYQYLTDLQGKTLMLRATQDANNVVAQVDTQVVSESQAKSLSSGFKLLLTLGINKKLSDLKKTQYPNELEKQKDQDELMLLQSAKVSYQGNKLVIRFEIPRAAAIDFITRKLNEPDEEDKSANVKQVMSIPASNSNSAVSK